VAPEELVARLWPGRPAQIEPLGGGITNHNFKVVVADGVFVLRIGGRDTELLGIDREAEHHASRIAAAAGVGPEVERYLPEERSLVTRFLEGRIPEPEELRRPETIGRVARALRRIHDGPPFAARFDSFRVVEAYRDTAVRHGAEVAPAYRDAKRTADGLERALGERPEAPCHNDLLNANFIDDGASIRIVDWEYAGMGDRFFDLANFAVNHGLDEDGDHTLLEAYFGAVRERDVAHLVAMRFMSDFREAMWGVLQSALSELDFDFAGYAAEHFGRLEGTARSARFHDAVRTLGAPP
jgi:thiamine kinase-like enzyme